MNVTKISQKMKKKLIEYSKKYYRMRKKYFVKIIRNYHFFLKNNDLESCFDEKYF